MGCICAVDDCTNPVKARTLCQHHYMQARRGHRLLPPLRDRSIDTMFWGKVVKGEGCWIWSGEILRTGYGRHWEANGRCLAHRRAYELTIGPIPKGFQLDHLCRNRACVNPAHLEAVTARVNNLRSQSPSAKNAAKTHCKRGHEFNEANTYRHKVGRSCRTCQRERDRRRRSAA
jgi:hypothetical protein